MGTCISKGCVVLSKAGRDKGNFFLVLDCYENYALIVDGKLRRVDSPKRKKIKHLMYVGMISNKGLLDELDCSVTPKDSEVRKAMNLFLTEEETQ